MLVLTEHIEEIIWSVLILVEPCSGGQQSDKGISVQEYLVHANFFVLDRRLKSIIIGTTNIDACVSGNTEPKVFCEVKSLIEFWSRAVIVDVLARVAEPHVPKNSGNALEAIGTNNSPPQILDQKVGLVLVHSIDIHS